MNDSKHEGFTVWLTGPSGAGKTTLAEAAAAVLRAAGRRVEVLDGDRMREILSPDLGFSRDARNQHVARVGYIARLLSQNGVAVLVPVISPYRSARDSVRRAHAAPFLEVFVDCALDELIRRDTKGLYTRALRRELEQFTCISDPYERPECPEIHLQTDRDGIGLCTKQILDCLVQRGLVSADRATRWIGRPMASRRATCRTVSGVPQ